MIQVILFYLLLGTSAYAKLFEDNLRVLKTDTTNACIGITPGNLTTCGGKSCLEDTGTIGNCSCVSTSDPILPTTACHSNNGTIGDGSCNGNLYSCGSNRGFIESNSCNDGRGLSQSCTSNGLSLSNITSYAKIGPNSCNNGILSCNANGYSTLKYSYGIIGAHSCNNGDFSCNDNGSKGHGEIGDHSCNGGPYSCGSNGADGTKGIIGNNACNAPEACNGNKGTIGDDCCNYKDACKNNIRTIKLGDDGCSAPTSAVTTPRTSVVRSLVTFSVALVQVL